MTTTPSKAFVLGEWMRGQGYSQAIYIRSVDRRLGYAPWNPSAPYVPFSGPLTTASFVARYGHRPEGLKGDGHDPSQAGIEPGLFEAGSTAGERGLTAADRLCAAAMLPSNPFGIADPENYRPKITETMDALYVRDRSEPTKSFFDGWLTRTLSVLDSPATLPAPTAPPIVKPPVVTTPPPPPIAPPAPVQGLPSLTPAGARVEELRAIVAEMVYGDPSLFPDRWLQLAQPLIGPSWPTVRLLAVSALKSWRKARRRLGDPRPLPD